MDKLILAIVVTSALSSNIVLADDYDYNEDVNYTGTSYNNDGGRVQHLDIPPIDVQGTVNNSGTYYDSDSSSDFDYGMNRSSSSSSSSDYDHGMDRSSSSGGKSVQK